MRLFFYGTLMDQEMLGAVLGRAPQHVTFFTGVLADFTLRRAEGYSFPVLVPERQGQVKGLVAQGLRGGDIDRIRYFEDVEYELQPLPITVEGKLTEAHAFCPNQRIAASAEAWDFTRWKRRDKPLLLAVTREVFTEHYGRTPIEAIDPVWHQIRARHERERKPAMRRPRRRIA